MRFYPELHPRITTRFVILALVAISRGCEILVEQPSGSIMQSFPYMQFLAMVIFPIQWLQVRLCFAQLQSYIACITIILELN